MPPNTKTPKERYEKQWINSEIFVFFFGALKFWWYKNF